MQSSPAISVTDQLQTGPDGLSEQEAETRLGQFGENKLHVKKKTPLIIQFFKQFKDLMVIILLIAGIISFIAGEEKEAIAILVVVVLNAIIGFFQEFKAEKAIEALQKMMAPISRVIRDGKEKIIPSQFLVPGDIIILNEGDRIGADGTILESNELQTQEAALTGESVPVSKVVENPSLNEIFLGTLVAHGTGKALVTKTGMYTAFGRIAHLTAETKKEKSPLEKELDGIGIFVGKITVIISGILLLSGIFIQHTPFLQTLLFATSVAVAAVPEGLPTIVTIALALGAQRLAKKNAIIKQLSSVETLGSTRVILSDKTGTLTKNEMTVQDVYLDWGHTSIGGIGYAPEGAITSEKNPHELAVKLLCTIANLCNNAKLNFSKHDNTWEIIGDPTEAAMLTLSEKWGFKKSDLSKEYKKITEIPFDSDRKRMSIIVSNEQKELLSLVKGAPDNILDNCTHVLENGIKVTLTAEKKEKIEKENEHMASKALRVIACAYKEIHHPKEKYNKEDTETDLTFVGLIGMLDPPRPEVIEAVQLTKQAGIRVYIVTGDHGLTAGAIAEKIGLVSKQEGYQIITGVDLNNMSDENLESTLQSQQSIIFARVSPEHKLRVATALKNLGEIIAVTGDGVNDAPALKKADIGIAMGITGTDVSKEAANMILADDSFSTIISAIEEGRTIYENLKKFIFFIFSCNIGEVAVVFTGLILGLPSPLSAILILMVNLGTDVLPALALGIDPAEKGIMKLPPRNPEKRILEKSFIKYLFVIGISIGIIVITAYIIMLYQYGWTWGQSLSINDFAHMKASSLAFATLVLIQVIHAYNARSQHISIFKIHIFNNWFLIGASIISIIFTIGVIEIPILHEYMGTTSLSAQEWLWAFGLSTLIIVPSEIWKFIKKQPYGTVHAY